MLFTELKKIQDDDIEQALEERLKARGLDPAILHQSLGGSDVTVEELISDVVDGLIAQAVDANRESFRARQRKGFEQAQAAGKSVGRPSRKSPEAFAQVRRMYEAHEISGAQAADLLGVARGTFYRWLKESTAEKNIKDRGGGVKAAIYHIFCPFTPRKSSKNGGRISSLHFLMRFIIFVQIPGRCPLP